jgi:hypothetical protein
LRVLKETAMSKVLRTLIVIGAVLWSLMWWGGYALIGWGEGFATGYAGEWAWVPDVLGGLGQGVIIFIWVFGLIAAAALFWLAGFLNSARVSAAGQQAGQMADRMMDELARRAPQQQPRGNDGTTVTLNKTDDGSYR